MRAIQRAQSSGSSPYLYFNKENNMKKYIFVPYGKGEFVLVLAHTMQQAKKILAAWQLDMEQIRDVAKSHDTNDVTEAFPMIFEMKQSIINDEYECFGISEEDEFKKDGEPLPVRSLKDIDKDICQLLIANNMTLQ